MTASLLSGFWRLFAINFKALSYCALKTYGLYDTWGAVVVVLAAELVVVVIAVAIDRKDRGKRRKEISKQQRRGKSNGAV